MKFAPHDLEAFGLRLSEARTALDWTRDEVAERVESIKSPQQLYNYEKGRRAPEYVEIIYELEDALGLPPSTLTHLLGFQRSDSKFTPSITDMIAADPQLSPKARKQVLSLYRAAVR